MRRFSSSRPASPESVLSGSRPWSLSVGEWQEFLSSFPDDSIDVVLMDPPYDKWTHSKQRRGCTGYTEPTRPSATRAQFSRARDLNFEPMTGDGQLEVAAEVARITKRWVGTFCSLEMISSWRDAFEQAGLEYVRTTIWHKLGATPQFTGDRPAQAAEAIVLAHRRGRKRWNGGGHHGWYPHGYGEKDAFYGYTEPDGAACGVLEADVLNCPIVLNRGVVRQRFHTAQKPLLLMKRLVELYSNPGEVILDPYAGSFTTGLAAVQLGRRVVGIERSDEYASWARHRMLEVGR